MVFQKQCKCPHLYLKRKHLLTFTFKSTLKFLQHSKVGLPQKEVGFSPAPAQVFVSSRDKLHKKIIPVHSWRGVGVLLLVGLGFYPC